ncbi:MULTISPECIES: hypothetical protein [unclassified Arthrobacter]|uniref:hypothetical protein n=1 Tax=unclassified Arthrobacter TaxID=235627 RepID=UPI001D13F4E2|nr:MULTISPECIES: hypothetical protein [unclassified Arthrobacter]MCC3276202.1 hypothetical protein [Arthrobacter sp. zg-Y20]MCC3280503.1 hypothetical protein [Arthrobacter sp. zg-Y40]MCC9178759.1 hypothetical protein [Arthrobacter sp. zg-Y750]MDK1316362.1 hypothetical protein [Arthrobacter sp. zg.Y20]WIB06409.1 hypothetical protein QNO06_01310 [Arthrobacter sp. zg-Y20]
MTMTPDLRLGLLATVFLIGAVVALYVPIIRGGTIKNASLTRKQWTIFIALMAAAALPIFIALIN